MKKKSLAAKKRIHKSLLNHLKDNRVSKVFSGFNNYLDKLTKDYVDLTPYINKPEEFENYVLELTL